MLGWEAFLRLGELPAEVLLDNPQALVEHRDAVTREVRFNARLYNVFACGHWTAASEDELVSARNGHDDRINCKHMITLSSQLRYQHQMHWLFFKFLSIISCLGYYRFQLKRECRSTVFGQ